MRKKREKLKKKRKDERRQKSKKKKQEKREKLGDRENKKRKEPVKMRKQGKRGVIEVRKGMLLLVISMFIFVLLLAFEVNAQVFSSLSKYVSGFNVQDYEPSFSAYYTQQEISQNWPILKEPENCRAERQDFIFNIRPGSCMPTVIRSDLLEDQNVPVYCQVDAIKLNPLIDVSWIKSVGFQGDYPDEVAGVSFRPARASLRIYNKLLTNPVINNIGYVMVILKSMPEKEMPESVEFPMTVNVRYDMENAFGTGKVSYFIPAMNDEDWRNKYQEYSFWNGKGYVRANWVGDDEAGISLYSDKDTKINEFTLNRGETSPIAYLPGYYCMAGVQVKLDDLTYPKISALLDIDGTATWIREGQYILDNQCRVMRIEESLGGKQVTVRCYGKNFNLLLRNRPAMFEVNGKEERKYVGEVIEKDNENYYVVYIGEIPEYLADAKKLSDEERQFVVLAKANEEDVAWEEKLIEMRKGIQKYVEEGVVPYSWQQFRDIVGWEVKQASDLDGFIKAVIDTAHTEWGAGIIDRVGRAVWEQDKDELWEKKPDIYVSINKDGYKPLIEVRSRTYQLSEGILGKWEKEGATIITEGIFDWELKAIHDEKKIIFQGVYELEDNELNAKTKSYFDKAKEQAEDLAISYHAEKSDANENYGELALYQTAELAGNLGQEKTQAELYEQLIKEYSDSSKVKDALNKLADLRVYDYGEAEQIIETRGGDYTIKLLEIKEPSDEDASAEFVVQTASGKEGIYTKKPGEDIVNEPDKYRSLSFEEIYPGKVVLKYSYREDNKKDGALLKEEYTLSLGEKQKIGDVYIVKVNKINYRQEATLSLLPVVPNMQSSANITFRIGIEKRAIQLSPEKTAEMISNLDESIKKWEGIVGNLGNLIKGLKAACFTTAAYLMIKNFFANMGGGVQARQEVMKKWHAVCKKESEGDRAKFDECLITNNDRIQADVANYKKNLGEVQDYVIDLQKKNKDTKTGNINQEKLKEKYINYLVEKYNLNKEALELASFEQLRDLELAFKNSGAGGETGKIGAEEKSKILQYLGEELEKKQNSNLQKEEMTKAGLKITDVQVIETPRTLRATTSYRTWGEIKGNINNNQIILDTSYVEPIILNGKKYLAVFDGKSDKRPANEWYIIEGNTLKKVDAPADIVFIRKDKDSLTNPWETPEVRYHESGGNKGLAYIVPLGSVLGNQQGWYVATRPLKTTASYDTLRQTPSYTEAAIPQFYYIGNVGEDGKENFEAALMGLGDDEYETVIAGTKPAILGLSDDDSKKLIKKAEEALMQANSRYKPGEKKVTVLGKDYNVGVPSTVSGAECTDFMSPSDCMWLFNLCDPVMCPTSRCDFGGKYPVTNVIQSGIIGSILLCLPNFGSPLKGGVAIPICLSGVHAGLDSYVNLILKPYRDCLQNSLDTGQYVGICDEIYSLYVCDFFWRQAVPLMKIGIPSLLGWLAGEKVRGGHEYLTIQDAWKNLGASISYFRDSYAVESYKAFQARSTEEVGTEVCKMFISQRYPTSKKFFDSLLEPDSPVQFHAWFDETLFSEATVPATSHYKVFYTIYAGKDQGIYFDIYLKDPPQISYYATAQTIPVKGGYLPQGETLTETKDFTAPAGYSQLCVRINGQDNCGFKSVSTSFALEWLRDKYVKEQAIQEVKTEEECISGTVSWETAGLAVIEPSGIQAGVETALKPEIYKRGIIRVCATQNPGEASDTTRWKLVGYCDNEKVTCWLDTKSVEEAIEQKGLEQEALGDIKSISEKLGGIEILSEKDTEKRLAELRNKFESLDIKELVTGNNIPDVSLLEAEKIEKAEINEELKDIIILANLIQEAGFLNKQKAEALSIKRNLFGKIADELWKKNKPKKTTTDLRTTEGAGGQAEKEAEEAEEGAETGVSEVEEVREEEAGELAKDESLPKNKIGDFDLVVGEEGKSIVMEITHNCDILSYKLNKNGNIVKEGVLGEETPKKYTLYLSEVGKYVVKAYCKDSNNNLIESKTSGVLVVKKYPPAEPTSRVSGVVHLVFYYSIGINDDVYVRWNFDTQKPEVHIRPNGKTYTKTENDFVWTSDPNNLRQGSYCNCKNDKDLENDIYPEDIIKIKYLLGAGSRDNLATIIYNAVRSGGVYLYDEVTRKTYIKNKIDMDIINSNLMIASELAGELKK